MKFSLIIPGHNEENYVEEFLKSCLNLNYPKDEYEIIYVENNSTDNSLAIAKKYPINIFIEPKQGPSEARNCGIAHAKGEILLFLDCDLKIDPNYLKLCEEKTFTDPSIGAGVGKILPLTKTWVSDYTGVALLEGYPRFNKYKFMRGAPSCNLAVRKSVLDKIGNFKEKQWSAIGITRFSEDKDLCERVKSAGYKILFNPQTFVYHENPSKFSKLINVWVKGSRVRATLIEQKKKDPFSLFFRYNLPLIGLLSIAFSFLLSFQRIGIALLFFGFLFILTLCIKSFVDTGLFFESFIIKPWIDTFSLIVINVSVLCYRIQLRTYEKR